MAAKIGKSYKLNIKSWKTEDGRRKTEDGSKEWKTEDGRRKSEGRYYLKNQIKKLKV